MTLQSRDRRALMFLAPALVLGAILIFWPSGDNAPVAAVSSAAASTPQALEAQLIKMQQKKAELPAKEGALKDLQGQLGEREKGLIVADTLPQAQALLVQILRQNGKTQGMDFRAVSMGQPRHYGGVYGEILVSATAECRIEQLVNFMADLTKRPELIATEEVHVYSANPKEKTVNLQITVTGLVPKKLVPEKKNAL